MKRSLLILTILPLFASADDMTLATNLRGLPEDFRRYFYNSEVLVQVYLNDSLLFSAAVALKENGDIRLIRIIEDNPALASDVRAQWSDILQQGVSAGQCARACPSGLMAVEYRLNHSELKLYTSQYETGQVRRDFITLPQDTPGGLIMYNDVAATDTPFARSWGINSSLISSFAGWSQKASFQSSGTDGHDRYRSASLYELFSQKELPGSFIRLGFFTPDNDTGNVQTAGFGYDSVAGAMWGTSDALLASSDSVSAWPVYVTGRSQSVAEVWRNGRLIHTQQLQSGVQALDTRPLPAGIYGITIKIIDNGQMADSQQAQIYKPQGWNNPDRRWRMNLWSGQRRTLASGDARVAQAHPFAAGGGVDMLVHPRATLGFSGAVTEQEYLVRTRASITLSADDSLFAQYTLGNKTWQASQNTDIRYYRNLPAGGSASLYWRSTTTDIYGRKTRNRQQGETWGSALALQLPWSSSLIVNSQYMDTAWRRGWGSDVAVTTLAMLAGRNVNFRLSAYDRPGFNDNRRDHGASLSASISLAPAARHAVSAETGINQNHGYSSLSYQWKPGDNSPLRQLGGSVSQEANRTLFSGNFAAESPWASGDMYVQHSLQSRNSALGGNLSQVLVIGGGQLAAINGNGSRGMESALIVDVEADDSNRHILASGNMAETRLSAGRNIVPAELWKNNSIQFTAGDGDSVQIFPERQSIQMNRGSVQYVKVKTVKTYTLVSMLRNEHGHLLTNRYVSSDVAGGMINAEGVLTLDTGVANRMLAVSNEAGQPALQCALPATTDQQKKVVFISALHCRTVSTGAEKE